MGFAPPTSGATARQASSSVATMAARSFGDPPPAPRLRDASTSVISGEASAVFSAAFRRSMTAGGVFAGANNPCQLVACNAASPASRVVGVSGSAEIRSGLATASAFSWPACSSFIVEAGVSNSNCTWPLIRSGTAAAPPLYGTCSLSMPVNRLKRSPIRWLIECMPNDAKLVVPGFALAYLTRSASVSGAKAFDATRMNGDRIARPTGARSFCGS